MKQDIKLFLVNYESVLSDNSKYFSQLKGELDIFNANDVTTLNFLKEKNIQIGIITSEINNAAKNRLKELNIDYLLIETNDKIKVINKLIKEIGLEWDNILYISDDISDLKLFNKVGISVCTKEAKKEIKNICNYVSKKNICSGVIQDIYDYYYVTKKYELEKDVFKLFDIPRIEISVNTFAFFKHCMKDNNFNAHIMIKMLAIDCFYKKNNFGWTWYNEMQFKRVKDNPLVPKYMANHEKEFKELIKSFEENGYLSNYPIIVNKDFIFIDGSHRLALALYFGIEKVPIAIDKEYYDIDLKDYSFEWFDEHGMDYMKEEAMKKKDEIYAKWGEKNG